MQTKRKTENSQAIQTRANSPPRHTEHNMAACAVWLWSAPVHVQINITSFDCSLELGFEKPISHQDHSIIEHLTFREEETQTDILCGVQFRE